MAKIKAKKKNFSDHIQKKKDAAGKKKLNPFEVHVNKEKMRVLGKKDKNDKGLPGISRAKAIEKRKRTLLKEYQHQNKANKFTDKRIGERNHSMSEEDKIMARYTAVRVKQQKKKSIFNLADDEVLTHKGQSLSEIEKFDDPRSDDEFDLDDDERRENGRLDAEFVGDAHFGGGLLKKTGQEGAKTHKELIDQLIAESKKRKFEKQKQKEATLELTEKLDTQWKDLIPLVNQSKKTEEDVDKSKTNVDDYDKLMRELKFEARGSVSDRLKTEQEIAKEEKEKLDRLEQERLDRMKGVTENEKKVTHRSADDLDDDFVYESETEPDMLTYNDEGEANVRIDAEINGKSITDDTNESNDEGNNSDNDENSDEDDDDSDNEKDDFSDLKTDEESCSDDENTKSKPSDLVDARNEENLSKNHKIDKQDSLNKESQKEFENKAKQTEKIKEDLQKRKEIMDEARKELPYTFSLPDSYESLQQTLESQSVNHQAVIIERMIKCNHPSLSKDNKDKLGHLFAYVLQYLNDLADVNDEKGIKHCFEVFELLIPHIYELAQFNPENAHKSLVEVIKEKFDEFRNNPKHYPGLEMLIFLQLVEILFTTSDFRHQVVTPCLIFMELMLKKCKVKTAKDIAYGFFICGLVFEYTKLSKRFMPMAMNYLAGLLHMAIAKKGVRLIKVIPPFKAISTTLVLINDLSSNNKSNQKMSVYDLIRTEVDDDFKIRIFYNVLNLLKDFLNNLRDLSSCFEIFHPILNYLKLIEVNNYPKVVQEAYHDLVKNIDELKDRKLEYLVYEAKKPKALRLYEPKIVPVYDRKTFKVQSREKAERDKLLHKLKREKKGALREIRRDKSFLGRVKITQQIQSDKERRDKVKRIYAEASIQQSELNAIDRKRKKK